MVKKLYTAQTKEPIDNLKGVCNYYGLTNDSNLLRKMSKSCEWLSNLYL